MLLLRLGKRAFFGIVFGAVWGVALGSSSVARQGWAVLGRLGWPIDWLLACLASDCLSGYELASRLAGWVFGWLEKLVG